MRAAAGHLLAHLAPAPALFLLPFACTGGTAGAPALPWVSEALAEPPEPADNASTPAKRELGRLLFYDPLLSADHDTACATCHSELWGMSDGLPRSVGTGGSTLTGPGRTGPNVTRRNAQTLWNVAYRDALMWDGRVNGLEAQVLLPLEASHELGRQPDELVDALAEVVEYASAFEDAFPNGRGELSVPMVAMALAAFERTLVTDRAPYDRFAAGDEGALDPESQRGMWRFEEAGCPGCHTPPRFESEQYVDRGLGVLDDPNEDPGRFEVTGASGDRNAFRVPTLRNLRESGPYFHDGREPDLRAAVAHELAQGHPGGWRLDFSAQDVDDLVAFIRKGLMDRTREPDRPEAVPSGLPVPVDGSRIPR